MTGKNAMSCKERLLTAMEGRQPDRVPCSFMIFAGLREQCKDQFDFVERQLELGLDARVPLPVRPPRTDRSSSEQGDLPGLPVRFGSGVEVRDWRTRDADERYPVLHREYQTPEGKLHTAVSKTDDWVQGDRVPIFDDFVIPRAREPLVQGSDDLAALRALLAPPTDEDVASLRAEARRVKDFAQKHGLPVEGNRGVLFDAACWLCGMEPLMMMTVERPDFLDQLLDVIYRWNRIRTEIVLDAGVDIFLRRAWYETADFLSPALYNRFILPRLKQEARLVHQAGAKLALITTSAYTPLMDAYLEAGVDVLVGLDPVQDHRADLPLTKKKLGGKVGLWGGVNGFVTVERGTEEDVRRAVAEAMDLLAPGGGFVLSPVDNVTLWDEPTRSNVNAFLETWRERRDYPC